MNILDEGDGLILLVAGEFGRGGMDEGAEGEPLTKEKTMQVATIDFDTKSIQNEDLDRRQSRVQAQTVAEDDEARNDTLLHQRQLSVPGLKGVPNTLCMWAHIGMSPAVYSAVATKTSGGADLAQGAIRWWRAEHEIDASGIGLQVRAVSAREQSALVSHNASTTASIRRLGQGEKRFISLGNQEPHGQRREER